MVDRGDADERAALLLERARDDEITLRFADRAAALAEVESLPTSAWLQLETRAERALDLAHTDQVEAAERAARDVLTAAGEGDEIAAARATEALGRALGWHGTASASRTAERHLIDAAARYAGLDRPDWQAVAVFWRGNAIYYQLGELGRACALFEQALALLPAEHGRRPGISTFYADALTAGGRLDEAEAVLDQAWTEALAIGEPQPRAYVQWSRARLAAARGDAFATERHLREIERDSGDWFDIQTGTMFLADAAELLDQVGLVGPAADYLRRAADRNSADEFVQQAQAFVAARSGEPVAALQALQRLASYDWLEKRQLWRLQALTAYATFRAGQGGAGEIAAAALHRAVESTGSTASVQVESDLTATLLPLAEAAGSSMARRLLTPPDGFLVRVLGPVRVHDAEGRELELPAGRPAELVRLLALHRHGRHVEQVLDDFFPDVPVATGRHRLRQVLTRLRSAAGSLVVRDDELLRLAPAWVDVREFADRSDRARGAVGARRVRAAFAALACWDGPPLPADVYADWAQDARERLQRRHLAMLDLVAADATARGSHEEALTALTAAIDDDPDDADRTERAARALIALGRPSQAQRLRDAARNGWADLDVRRL